jgi:dihydrolipoamide dehydrogenase
VLLATGSQPIAISGLEFDQRQIIDSTRALALEKAPERLVVVGGGAVGLELGQLWQRLGGAGDDRRDDGSDYSLRR